MENENLSRLEQYLRAIAESTGTEQLPIPQSRLEEIFLAIATGDDSNCPVPQSRLEAYACACIGAGGGTATPTQEKTITITENGTVEVLPDEGYALGKVTANAQVYDAVDDRVKQLIEGTLTELSDDSMTSLRNFACYHLKSLTTVNFPNATDINSSAFEYCSSLITASFPNVTNIGSNIFTKCTNLTTVDFPKLAKISSGAFSNCSNLTTITFPATTELASAVFTKCSNLTTADFPKLTKFTSDSFSYCEKFTTLILRNAKVCSNLSTSSLRSTPFAENGTGGICLVPSAFITEYQNATNWSTFYAAGTCLFWALEDYTIDGTIEGEIDWDKLNTDREGVFATV